MSINTTNLIQPSQQAILIVEDEFAVANDLRNILEKAGYGVSGIAFTVAKALELKNQQKPDLVLLDIKLAGALDGISTGFIIQSTYALPIIYLSDMADAEIVEPRRRRDPTIVPLRHHLGVRRRIAGRVGALDRLEVELGHGVSPGPC